MEKAARKKDTTRLADEEPSPEENALHSPTLGDVIRAITATREELETKIDTLGADLSLLRDDHADWLSESPCRTRTLEVAHAWEVLVADFRAATIGEGAST
ncbi:hypothetical protein NDU88_007442 [Pleurodeles waltl]|uniref:Uncharacterized protein n=1 Tax=Pleurodeles waltl TaxID=8319 RepID=A0AAV7PP05_PLEWA|nr:hypothetical protein NDU88_007442 [Pleurodeles waltl]